MGLQSNDFARTLRAGIGEYWILDPGSRLLHVLQRADDVWVEVMVPTGAVYHPHLLPGLEVRPEELFGPPEDE
jgi:Uma2 family endonuclease